MTPYLATTSLTLFPHLIHLWLCIRLLFSCVMAMHSFLLSSDITSEALWLWAPLCWDSATGWRLQWYMHMQLSMTWPVSLQSLGQISDKYPIHHKRLSNLIWKIFVFKQLWKTLPPIRAKNLICATLIPLYEQSLSQFSPTQRFQLWSLKWKLSVTYWSEKSCKSKDDSLMHCGIGALWHLKHHNNNKKRKFVRLLPHMVLIWLDF